jgi:hypothetical protein
MSTAALTARQIEANKLIAAIDKQSPRAQATRLQSAI